jgi:hypothetical protein
MGVSDNTYFEPIAQNESQLEVSFPNISSNWNNCQLLFAGARDQKQGDINGTPPNSNKAPFSGIVEQVRMNMNNRNFVRGLCLIAIALLFGVVAINKYSIGQLSRSGPGMFPLLVSSMLFLVGLLTLVRSRFVDPVALDYNVKNIAIILVSLVGFTVISEFVNMIPAIIFLVFVSTYAGTSYSVKRNIKISIGLIAVAYGFEHLLGLNLPLFY